MYKFQSMKTPKLIIIQVLLETLLVEVYGLIVEIILKLNSNSCCINIHLSDDVWDMILIQFELI